MKQIILVLNFKVQNLSQEDITLYNKRMLNISLEKIMILTKKFHNVNENFKLNYLDIGK